MQSERRSLQKLFDTRESGTWGTHYFVAPGEGQRPLPIQTEQSFKEIWNPDKYPQGRGGLMANRVDQLLSL